MKKFTNTIAENINKIVNEEMGINTSVENSANEVANEIENAIKTKGSKEGNFKAKIVGHQFSVYWKTVICDNKEDVNKNNYAKSVFIGRISMLNVAVGVMENGYMCTECLADSIYHELSHIFQQDMAGKEYPGQMLYIYSLQNKGKNLVYFNIWRALYGSNTMEQDSMVNGMYGYVMERVKNDINSGNFNGTIDQYIMDSEAMAWLNNLYEAEEFLNNAKNTSDYAIAFNDYKEKFKLTPKKLFSIVSDGKKRFEEKIARAEWLCKCRQAERFPLSEQVSGKYAENFEAAFQFGINLKNCIFD